VANNARIEPAKLVAVPGHGFGNNSKIVNVN
jgi:hypothetical protein